MGNWAYPWIGLPIFSVPPIISGFGKATYFKFCTHNHRVIPNKRPWKIWEKVELSWVELNSGRSMSEGPFGKSRCVKYGLKTPNRLWKNVWKPQGGGYYLTHTVCVSCNCFPMRERWTDWKCVFTCVCVTAIDLTYGVVLCFGCHDYVYCDEVDMIAQSQRQLAGTSLGTN